MTSELTDAQAVAETLTILTPADVPEWVECYVSKRQIRGAQARQVEYRKGRNVWIDQRYLGIIERADADDLDEFDEAYAELSAADATVDEPAEN